MLFRGVMTVLFIGIGMGMGMGVVGCGNEDALLDGAEDTASDVQEITTNSQAALDWASDWISEVKAQPSRLLENEYTSSATELQRMSSSVKAKNRNVCGTLVTQLIQKSVGFTSSDFYNSFNKAMDGSCETGSDDGGQKGTTSPNAAQYRYKIQNCGGTGPIKFTRRDTISAVRSGDVLAVSYPDRSDITGHVMIVRRAPVADKSLPAGPSGSTPYTVDIIDSTSTPHGSAANHPDWRGGNTRQGLGSGTFVLYASSSGAIVGSRWSPTDSKLSYSSRDRVAIGGLR